MAKDWRNNGPTKEGQKSPKGTVRPPVTTVQQQSPPPPTTPKKDN